jgi:hypothetical protein
MITKAIHPSIEGNPRTFLTAKANLGQAVLAVQNVAEFAVNDLLVIGNPTEELTEIKKISDITGKNITLSANLINSHSENTKITIIKYDQVKFYKADSISGTYNVVSTKDLAIGEPSTLYDDASALSTDYFKIRYYNSQTTDLSVFSDPIASGGFPRYALASIVDAVFKRFGDKKKQVLEVEEIIEWVNEGKDDMANEIAESNEKHFNGYHQIAINATTGEGDLEDDFKKEQSVRVSYNGAESASKRARRIDVEDLEDQELSYNENDPVWYFNKYKIGIRPKGNGSAVAFVRSEDHPADLVNDSDELPKPIRFYLHVLMDYLMMRAMEKDRKPRDAQAYEGKYEGRKEVMIEHINNLSLDENRGIKDEIGDE